MAHKVSFHYSAFSHNLQTVSAREHRFNLVLVDRSIETSLRLHLAFDHSSINCAINWGTRNRGLLLSCLANTFVLCVFGVSANISLSSFLEFLCSKLQDSVLSQPIPIQLLEWGEKSSFYLHLHGLFTVCSGPCVRTCTLQFSLNFCVSAWLNPDQTWVGRQKNSAC